jgi:hypothetical protein
MQYPTLKIIRHNIELAQVPLAKPQLLVGRSPACDGVLRAPGVEPLHFLVEWVGDGPFDSSVVRWNVTDISASVRKDFSGEGRLLGAKGGELGGFQFQLVDSQLESSVKPGALSASVIKTTDLDDYATQDTALEVFRIRKNAASLERIMHFSVPVGRVVSLRGDAKLSVEGTSQDTARIHWASGKISSVHFLYQFGMSGADDRDDNSILLRKGQFLRLRGAEHDYLFRFVPRIRSLQPKRELLADPLFVLVLVALMAAFGSLLFLKSQPVARASRDVQRPQRVARVEVAAPKVIPAEPTPIDPPTMPSPPTPVKIADQAHEAQLDLQTEKVAPTPKPVAKQKGLLGLLKSNRKNESAVNANDLVQAAGKAKGVADGGSSQRVTAMPVSESVDVRGGQVKESLTGLVKALEPKGDSHVGDGSTNLAKLAKLKLGGETTSGLGTNYKNSGDESGLGYGSGGELSVTGGLTKEQVLEALNMYRRQVRACYERALLINPKAQGLLLLRWTVNADGTVRSTQVLRNELGNLAAGSCVEKVINEIRFSTAKVATVVIYPYRFIKN